MFAGQLATMADHPPACREFHYRKVEIFHTEVLGTGSYGAVCKAQCDELPCAAKLLHIVLFQFNDPGVQTTLARFVQECQFLSAIQHPCIVQYLGVYRDPDSGLPILLMELLDENLSRFLEQCQEPLPYHIELNICYDIALALAYLHFNGIIHRDLSSNNVLISSGSRAKVSDFGMSKIANMNPGVTPLTQCPGTVAYMPPEALNDALVYTEKLDCFSFGVLCVQIMTLQFPEPGSRFKVIEINDPRFPTGRVEVVIPEIERRQSHIDLIDPAHSILPVAVHCLHNVSAERPSAREVCDRLYALKRAPPYSESVQLHDRQNIQRQHRELQKHTEQQQLEIEQLHLDVLRKTHQLEDLESQVQTLQSDLEAMDSRIEQQNVQYSSEIQGLHRQLQTKDRQLLAVNQQLHDSKKRLNELSRCNIECCFKIHEFQTKLQTLEQEIKENQEKLNCLCCVYTQEIQTLSEQLKTKDQQLLSQAGEIQEKVERVKVRDALIEEREMQPVKLGEQLQTDEQEIAKLQEKILKINVGGQGRDPEVVEERWAAIHRKLKQKNAPSVMCMGTVAMDCEMAYFSSAGSVRVYAYHTREGTWSSLPNCPYTGFSLASVNGLLTAIGGEESLGLGTNQVLSLTGARGDGKWVEQFPPMPTERWNSVAICCKELLLVAGGRSKWIGYGEQTVELMSTESLQWTTAANLPHPFGEGSATICGDHVYLLGGDERSKCFLACPLSDLAPSSHGGRLRKRDPWLQLANTPFYTTSCVAVGNRLVAVGGRYSDKTLLNAVHEFDAASNSWCTIGHMQTARYRCLLAVLPRDKVLVVGGTTRSALTNETEIIF